MPIKNNLSNGSLGGAIGLQQLPQSSTGLQTVTIRGGQAILTDGKGGQTLLSDGKGQTILGDTRAKQTILADGRIGQSISRQSNNSVQGIKSVVPSSVQQGRSITDNHLQTIMTRILIQFYLYR